VVNGPSDADTFREEGEDLSESVSRGPRSEAVLTVLRGANPGALYTVIAAESVVGRSADVEVPIPDDSLSRRHARIRRAGTRYTLEDLGSTNGTFVDGTRVTAPHLLEDGCRIFLGTRTVLHFRLHDAVELEAARLTHALTVRDPLTGLYNRRHLQERLWAEVAFARRHGTPLSLLLVDVDHFKQINDGHGHAAGDAVLRALAKDLTTLTREEDVLARYGGEEFALVARGIDKKATLLLAERIRSSVEAQRLPIEGGNLSCTVSIGVAYCDSGEEVSAQQMFEAADRALYACKDGGRNRVSLATGET
jgi:two-component system cell cycle response regulator